VTPSTQFSIRARARPGTTKGRRRLDDAFHFDYVCGYRIKVDYLPFGISIYEDSP